MKKPVIETGKRAAKPLKWWEGARPGSGRRGFRRMYSRFVILQIRPAGREIRRAVGSPELPLRRLPAGIGPPPRPNPSCRLPSLPSDTPLATLVRTAKPRWRIAYDYGEMRWMGRAVGEPRRGLGSSSPSSALRVAEGAGGLAGRAGEELAEVGGLCEAEAVADGGNRDVGMGQQAFGLQGDARVDEVPGSVTGGALAGAVEGLEGVAEPVGVVVGLAQGGEGAFEFPLEEAVRLQSGEGRRVAVGGGEAGDAQQYPGQQLAQELSGDLGFLVRRSSAYSVASSASARWKRPSSSGTAARRRGRTGRRSPARSRGAEQDVRREQHHCGVQVGGVTVERRGQPLHLPGADVQQSPRSARAVDEIDHAEAFAAVDQSEVMEDQPVHSLELRARKTVDQIGEGEDLQSQMAHGVAITPLDHRSLSPFDHHHA